jgi:TolB-like protein/class 3 adenylate cyclase/Tfp pilus assembly protein PilF
MPAEIKKEIQLEIAHILFIDIVGYSKLSMNEQRAAVDELNEVVRASEQLQKAEASDRLIKIPTGDGMAVVFYASPEAPVQCAIEISRARKEHPRLQLRMGVHSGPVSGVIDVNGRANLAGAGLNIGQRVMDCGDAGHILLSKHVAEDLEAYEQWRPLLHDLGTCEVKHGVRLSVVNLYSEQSGNAALPKKFQILRTRKTQARWAVLTAALLALIAIGTVFAVFLRNRPSATLPALEKSIAVLPFENLSEEKQNAYFVDGVQDEILTDLAKIADLKVISRTSVMQYKTGITRNLRQIAQELGVANVLEGSVQRAGNRVRVSAQLLDARKDVHLWAEHYDRPLDDVFAIQSEIAKAIADQLRAKLSPQEKTAIEKPPTADLAAFDLYTRANALLRRSPLSGARKDNLLQASELLNQAVARDPHFLLAYCRLVFAHDVLYLTNLDHTASRRALGEAAVQSALRLQPHSGETHLAIARHLYSGYLDYDRAKQELAIAEPMLPNSSELLELKGYIERRRGHWDEAARSLQKAIELDPLNFFVVSQLSTIHHYMRDYAQAAAVLDRALAIAPKDVTTRLQRAQVDLSSRADTKPLHGAIDAVLSEDPSAAAAASNIWLNLAFCERDPIAADRALVAVTGDVFAAFPNAFFNRSFTEGLIAGMRGDSVAAHAALTAARVQQEGIVRAQPENAAALSVLGLIDAALGRKDDALREGRSALELLPITRDALVGGDLIQLFSVICAWTGEKELALQQLSEVAQIPSSLSYGRLRLLPFWDPLRGDPRFEKIVASLAPKE